MMNDEQMQLQMMGHMTENIEMMEQMRKMMEDPETRGKMINLMIEHTEQFQELRSQELDDEQFNQRMIELMKQHMEKMQDLMKGNSMHQMMNP